MHNIEINLSRKKKLICTALLRSENITCNKICQFQAILYKSSLILIALTHRIKPEEIKQTNKKEQKHA